MTSERERKRIVDKAVPVAERDAFVAYLTAELPEARLIKRITDAGTGRVITFELLSEEPRR